MKISQRGTQIDAPLFQPLKMDQRHRRTFNGEHHAGRVRLEAQLSPDRDDGTFNIQNQPDPPPGRNSRAVPLYFPASWGQLALWAPSSIFRGL